MNHKHVNQKMKNILLRVVGLQKEKKPSSEKVEFTYSKTKHLEYAFNRCCKKCSTMKAPTTHHCSQCGSCISEMDHHCPWVNNCVGFYNQKYFLQFLVYVFLGSTHAVTWIIYTCYPCFWARCAPFETLGGLVLLIVSVFLGILFAIFVVVMFYDQMDCILSNQSTIDQLQLKRGNMDSDISKMMSEKRSGWENVKMVFGGDFDIWWLFPTEPPKRLVFEQVFD